MYCKNVATLYNQRVANIHQYTTKTIEGTIALVLTQDEEEEDEEEAERRKTNQEELLILFIVMGAVTDGKKNQVLNVLKRLQAVSVAFSLNVYCQQIALEFETAKIH